MKNLSVRSSRLARPAQRASWLQRDISDLQRPGRRGPTGPRPRNASSHEGDAQRARVERAYRIGRYNALKAHYDPELRLLGLYEKCVQGR